MRAENLLDKHAKQNMVVWSLERFKITHPRLLKSIIGAINEASPKIRLGMTVYHKDIYWGKESMKVVGIRENEVELEGDYSGGTHNVCQKDWVSIEGLLFEKAEL
jgi:hypothetical protein